MSFTERYARNGLTVTSEEHKILMSKSVLVAGCGGLGGYIIEMLARIGVGGITAVDPDVFDETNLNRQLLCEETLLGSSKADAAGDRVERINSEVKLTPIIQRIDVDNGLNLLGGHDLVIDALDNVEGRIIVQNICEGLSIPLVHGAISGWFGQVATLMPGDRLFDRIYPKGNNTAVDNTMGNPSFSPAVIAGFQVAEVVKVLTGKGDLIRNKMLYVDMLSSQFEIIDL